MDDEFGRLWKKVVGANILSQHLPGGTEENNKLLIQNIRLPGPE
jgi:hypothetical protein